MKYVALLKPDNSLILDGQVCITSLEELYTSICYPECTELEITKEFADEFFSYRGLVDFVSSVSTLFPYINVYVDDTMYKDLDDATRTLLRYKTAEEFIFALTSNPTRVMQTIRELCKYYFEVQEDSAVASNKIATLLMSVGDLQKENANLAAHAKDLEEQSNEAMAKLHSLVNRVNFQYEKTIDESSLFELSENQFIKILYIKEISRVHYLDTLVYYLCEIIKTTYNEPMRKLAIEPFYSYKRSNLYPGYTPHWKLTYRDVYSMDIFMAGFQPRVVQNILKNPNHIHYLVVIDRSGCNAPFIKGFNVETLYTVSDLKDAGIVNPKDLISYSSQTLNIPYIENFDDLTSEEKIQKYSTMPVMLELLNRLEKH